MKEMYKGFEIVILRDECAESPRDWDNLGTLAIVQNRYFDGDETVTKDTVTDILNDPELIALPVYAHVHSDVTLSTLDFADRFDSGMAGVIYVDIDYAKQELGEAFSNENVIASFKSEIETYSRYLSGDVIGYVIKHNGELLDSCWGFYSGTVADVLAEAKKAADCIPIESCTIIVPDNNSGIGKEVCNGFKN